jgi:phytoene/squalene synthetase
MKRLTTVAGAVGALGVAVLGSSGATAAAPSGFANFGNAQDTVNALTAAGYNVQINGATAFPLSSCKVIQVEGLNNSNIHYSGKRIDPTKFDTVYVDVSCRGG